MDVELRVLFSHLSPSIDTHCQDDALEFNKPSSSFPRKGRGWSGEKQASPHP